MEFLDVGNFKSILLLLLLLPGWRFLFFFGANNIDSLSSVDVCFRRVHTYRDESLSAPPTSPDSIREQTDVTGSGRLVSRCLIDHGVPSCQLDSHSGHN